MRRTISISLAIAALIASNPARAFDTSWDFSLIQDSQDVHISMVWQQTSDQCRPFQLFREGEDGKEVEIFPTKQDECASHEMECLYDPCDYPGWDTRAPESREVVCYCESSLYWAQEVWVDPCVAPGVYTYRGVSTVATNYVGSDSVAVEFAQTIEVIASRQACSVAEESGPDLKSQDGAAIDDAPGGSELVGNVADPAESAPESGKKRGGCAMEVAPAVDNGALAVWLTLLSLLLTARLLCVARRKKLQSPEVTTVGA